MIVGFTCGSFDLCHTGHFLMFEDCKKDCDYLIVGLHTDPSTDRSTKNKPIQTVFERNVALRSCKYIDEIVIYETEAQLLQLLHTMKIDYRFIGEDWRDKPFTGHDLPISVIYTSRDHDYSTTNLRKRIIEQGY